MRDNQVVGFEVEVLMLCARELHMGVTLSDMPFDALLASVQSGKVDVGLGCISITEERQQSMDLTVPTYNGACRFVVRTVEPDEAGSFFKGIAESFERIHRSNLIGMGLLPLQFKDGENAETLGLDGTEEYTIDAIDVSNGLPQPSIVGVHAKRADGSVCDFEAVVRIDTPTEGAYYAHGGILQYVLRSLI